MSPRDRIGRLLSRAQRRLPGAVLRRRHGEPPTIDGRTLDLHVHAYQQRTVKARAKRATTEVTTEIVRNGFDRMAAVGSADPIAAVSVHDRTIPGPASELGVRLYHPTRTEGRADAIVWFHQGGGVIGGLDTDHTLCSMLSEAGQAVVVSINYRLAPEHPFPADVVDSLAAYQWVVDNADGLGIDPARVAVGGTSQGGKISAVIAQERRREGLAPPLAQLLLYPGLDATFTGGSRDSMMDAWPLSGATIAFFGAAGGVDESRAVDLRASPALAADLAGTPPTLLVNAGFDPLRDEAFAYAKRLADAEIALIHWCADTLPHSFTLMGGVSKAAEKATERIAADAAKLLADA